jgi:hypothetical protein
MALGADGNPIISYHDHSSANLRIAHCKDPACECVQTSDPDTTGSLGWQTDIAIGADGLPLVSYYDETNGDLKLLHCGVGSCAVPLD